jgi:hypothetical protein
VRICIELLGSGMVSSTFFLSEKGVTMKLENRG